MLLKTEAFIVSLPSNYTTKKVNKLSDRCKFGFNFGVRCETKEGGPPCIKHIAFRSMVRRGVFFGKVLSVSSEEVNGNLYIGYNYRGGDKYRDILIPFLIYYPRAGMVVYKYTKHWFSFPSDTLYYSSSFDRKIRLSIRVKLVYISARERLRGLSRMDLVREFEKYLKKYGIEHY